MLVADENGRYPLSTREYDALKSMFAAYNSLCCGYKVIEERIRTQKNGWRDLKMILTMTDKVLADLLNTVPQKKLQQIRQEMQKTHVILKTETASGNEQDGVVYMMGHDLYELVKQVDGFACLGCRKTCKKARSCPVYKAINQVYPYDFQISGDGICPFSDLEEVEEINKEVQKYDT